MAAERLRILLCTRGGLHGALVLERLLGSERVEVAGIVLSSRIEGPSRGWLAGAARHLRRSGIRYSLYLLASTALADLALATTRRGSVRSKAARRHIPVHATRRIDAAATREFIARSRPDLLVSAFFDQRIDAPAVASAPLGAVNIHPSALPALRGVDPVFRALQRNAPALGVTVHRVTDDWDAGPIVATATLPRRPGETVLAATARLYDAGAALLVGSLDAIEAGEPGTAQQGEGCYDSWPARADSAVLARLGVKLARPADLLRGTAHPANR